MAYRDEKSFYVSVGVAFNPLIKLLTFCVIFLNIAASDSSTAFNIAEPPDYKNCFSLLIFTILLRMSLCSCCNVESIVRLVGVRRLRPMLPSETDSTTRYGNSLSILILTVEATPCSTTVLLVISCITECFSTAYLICSSATDLMNSWYSRPNRLYRLIMFASCSLYITIASVAIIVLSAERQARLNCSLMMPRGNR